mmetsp:Transcript_21848/g.49788  ORF Transcript_21848/g.49788 Transcript_21848/m.49788 type:complete len:289 (-) Transcript_21848:155-1021(-)
MNEPLLPLDSGVKHPTLACAPSLQEQAEAHKSSGDWFVSTVKAMSSWALVPQEEGTNRSSQIDEVGDVTYDSPLEDWMAAWPLASLPVLPRRGAAYIGEALHGIAVVGGLCLLFIFLTDSAIAEEREEGLDTTGPTPIKLFDIVAWWLIRLWALIACFCTLYILFGRADVIKRSPQTAYPIPLEVRARLRANQPLHGMANVEDTVGVLDSKDGSRQKLGSYCVRCLVWRAQDAKAHHCSVCERCVCNFDHHCGVFGRCIVDGNMTCFYGNIAMLMLGVLTTVFTMSVL